MTTKACTKCGEVKELTDFYKRKDASDGYAYECKKCNKNRNSNWYQTNSDYWKNRMREKRIDNPEPGRTRSRLYAIKNRESNRLRSREWAKNNPDRRVIQNHLRRTRKRGNGVFVVLEKEIRRLKNSPCVNCGQKHKITLDHIVSLKRGGRHSIGNLQPLCSACNSSKQDKFMVEWRCQQPS